MMVLVTKKKRQPGLLYRAAELLDRKVKLFLLSVLFFAVYMR